MIPKAARSAIGKLSYENMRATASSQELYVLLREAESILYKRWSRPFPSASQFHLIGSLLVSFDLLRAVRRVAQLCGSRIMEMQERALTIFPTVFTAENWFDLDEEALGDEERFASTVKAVESLVSEFSKRNLPKHSAEVAPFGKLKVKPILIMDPLPELLEAHELYRKGTVIEAKRKLNLVCNVLNALMGELSESDWRLQCIRGLRISA